MDAIDVVTVIVFDARGRVLLVRRRDPPEPGSWAPVSGRIEPGEAPQAAAIREVREEAALRLARTAYMGQRTVVASGSTLRVFEFIGVVEDERAAPVAGDDATAAAFVDDEALAAFRLSPRARDVLSRGMSNRALLRVED